MTRGEVASLIRQGYRGGNDPSWSIVYAFDHDDASQEGRIEEIADEVERGLVVGPDWRVAIRDGDGTVLEASVPLDEARRATADAVWLQYDFGTDAVGDSDGWESVLPGDEWHRTAHLESDEADVDDASSAVRLTIRFVPGSAAIAEVHAVDDGGNRFGSIDLVEDVAP